MVEILRKNRWLGIFIFAILLIVAIMIPFKFGLIDDLSKIGGSREILRCFGMHSVDLGISVYVIVIACSFWNWYVKNFLSKSYEDIVYFLEKEEDVYKFIDKDGIVLVYKGDEYISKTFYKVFRTRNIVCEIQGKADDGFDVRPARDEYWSKCCFIFGNYSIVAILPLLYLFLILAISMAITAPFLEKFKYVCLCLLISFFLVYDWLYKTKERSDMLNGKFRENSDTFMKIWTLGATFKMMISFLIIAFFAFLIVMDGNIFSVVFLSFFLFTMMSSLFSTLSELYNNMDILISYENAHAKSVKYLLYFVIFMGIIFGLFYEDFLWILVGGGIGAIGLLILKRNEDYENKNNEKKTLNNNNDTDEKIVFDCANENDKMPNESTNKKGTKKIQKRRKNNK